jgi:hypothetical protein
VYLTVSQVAKLMGGGPEWNYKRVRRWLIREGCLLRRAGTCVTTLDLLRAKFPEVWDRVEQDYFERNE